MASRCMRSASFQSAMRCRGVRAKGSFEELWVVCWAPWELQASTTGSCVLTYCPAPAHCSSCLGPGREGGLCRVRLPLLLSPGGCSCQALWALPPLAGAPRTSGKARPRKG